MLFNSEVSVSGCSVSSNLSDIVHLTHLSCIYQNTRGIKSKLEELNAYVSSVDFSFLCVSETWLTKDVLDAELFPIDLTVYRADRNLRVSGKTRGGGVLLAH